MVAGRMLLTTVLDATDVHSAALPIALVALHVVAVADFLSVWCMCDQLQLGPRQKGGLKRLAALSTFLSLAAFALALGRFVGTIGTWSCVRS